MPSKSRSIMLHVMATPEEAHLLRSYFDPRHPVKVSLVEPAPGYHGDEYVPGEHAELRVEFKGMAPSVETMTYSLRKVWVKAKGLWLDEDRAKLVLDALAEAAWSCTQMRQRHEAMAREFHYAGYEKSADAREGCANDNAERASAFEQLWTILREKLEP